MTAIAFWIPDVFLNFDMPNCIHMGGREWNVVRTAEELAVLDYHVTIHCPMPRPRVKNGVRYVSPDAEAPDADVLVVLNGYEILAQSEIPKKIVWVPTGLPDLREWREHIDLVVVSSPAKGDALCRVNRWLRPQMVVPVYSGTDLADYAHPVPRRDNQLLWCSSRDRGLHHLLDWWPHLRKARPDLTLHVTGDARGFASWRWTHEARAELLHRVEVGLTQDGITDLGGVPRAVLVREQQEATLWTGPFEFYGGLESGSFTVVEACAARLPMLLSADSSVIELGHDVAFFLPFPIDAGQWIAAILDLLDHPDKRRRFEPRQAEVARQYTWANAAQKWHGLLAGPLGFVSESQLAVV